MIKIRYTNNFKLTMDEQGDYYDVLRVNQNWAKLDALIASLKEKIETNVDKNIQMLAKRVIPTKTEEVLLANSWKETNGLYTYSIFSGDILDGEEENRVDLFPKVSIDTEYLEKLKQIKIIGAVQESRKITLISSIKPEVDIDIILFIYASGQLIEDTESGESESEMAEIKELFKQIEQIKETLIEHYLSDSQIATVVENYDDMKSKI